MDALSYPETNSYRAAYMASKSRRLASGEHEAVAAFFFDGKRKNQFFAIRETRAAALRAAENLSKTGGKE